MSQERLRLLQDPSAAEELLRFGERHRDDLAIATALATLGPRVASWSRLCGYARRAASDAELDAVLHAIEAGPWPHERRTHHLRTPHELDEPSNGSLRESERLVRLCRTLVVSTGELSDLTARLKSGDLGRIQALWNSSDYAHFTGIRVEQVGALTEPLHEAFFTSKHAITFLELHNISGHALPDAVQQRAAITRLITPYSDTLQRIHMSFAGSSPPHDVVKNTLGALITLLPRLPALRWLELDLADGTTSIQRLLNHAAFERIQMFALAGHVPKPSRQLLKRIERGHDALVGVSVQLLSDRQLEPFRTSSAVNALRFVDLSTHRHERWPDRQLGLSTLTDILAQAPTPPRSPFDARLATLDADTEADTLAALLGEPRDSFTQLRALKLAAPSDAQLEQLFSRLGAIFPNLVALDIQRPISPARFDLLARHRDAIAQLEVLSWGYLEGTSASDAEFPGWLARMLDETLPMSLRQRLWSEVFAVCGKPELRPLAKALGARGVSRLSKEALHEHLTRMLPPELTADDLELERTVVTWRYSYLS